MHNTNFDDDGHSKFYRLSVWGVFTSYHDWVIIWWQVCVERGCCCLCVVGWGVRWDWLHHCWAGFHGEVVGCHLRVGSLHGACRVCSVQVSGGGHHCWCVCRKVEDIHGLRWRGALGGLVVTSSCLGLDHWWWALFSHHDTRAGCTEVPIWRVVRVELMTAFLWHILRLDLLLAKSWCPAACLLSNWSPTMHLCFLTFNALKGARFVAAGNVVGIGVSVLKSLYC